MLTPDDVPAAAIIRVSRAIDMAISRRVTPILARLWLLEHNVASFEHRLRALERRRTIPDQSVLDRAMRESAAGNWEPWRWAEEAGMSEPEFRRALERRAQN